MSQPPLTALLEEAEKKLEKAVANVPVIRNSTPPKNDLFREIVAKVNISDLASEFGVETCPNDEYPIIFDDTAGTFCCQHKKYGADCDCGGGILEFTRKFG